MIISKIIRAGKQNFRVVNDKTSCNFLVETKKPLRSLKATNFALLKYLWCERWIEKNIFGL